MAPARVIRMESTAAKIGRSMKNREITASFHLTSRQGDKETRRQGDKETRRQGDKETRRGGERETRGSWLLLFPYLPLSPSPPLLFSLSPSLPLSPSPPLLVC